MKKPIIGMLLAGIMGMFFACQKDSPLSTTDDLVNTISTAGNKQMVLVTDLAPEISGYVNQHYSPVSIEAAWHVSKAGFEVAMEDGQLLYFNERHLFLGNDDGSRHPHGKLRCLKGQPANADDLPAAAVDYIAENYPGETIELVKIKPSGAFAVKLSNGDILLFSPQGMFFRECGKPAGPGGPGGHGGGHPCGCMQGETVTAADLPVEAAEYVNENYPDETIEAVVLKASGKFAVELGDGTVLLFDTDGTFIKECGVMEPGLGGYGPWGPHGHHGGMGPGGNGGGNFGGTQISPEELPQPAQDYLSSQYPDATVEVAFQKPNGFFFVKLSNGEKLLFGANGNILFDSGN